MRLSCRFFAGAVIAVAAGLVPAVAGADPFYAASVVSYTPGQNVPAAYQNTAAVLGGLDPVTDTYGDVLTPFNPAYTAAQVLSIGPGGSLTVKLGGTAATTGYTLGVHAAVGLADAAFATTNPAPNQGTNYNPAQTLTGSTYGAQQSADVQVSQDGTHWVDLGTTTFEQPSNYYSDVSGPYANSAGSAVADAGQPFTGTLSDFNGLDWAQTLAELNGSAGGTWLNTAGTGLSGINFVQFNVAPGAATALNLDAVAAVPEPATFLPLAAGVACLTLARRKKHRCAGGAI